MKVMVVGGGGREHVLTWKLAQSNKVKEIFVAPGNAGTANLATNVDLKAGDIEGLMNFALKNEIDLTFVGPEAPLVGGIVDRFQKEGLKIVGPTGKAARLEGSKVFAKKLMKENKIPTAEYETFTKPEEAVEYINKIKKDKPVVVKAEGLAAGKGVVVAETKEKAIEAVEKIMVDKKFGEAGERIIIEEYLEGEEASVISFVDGETIIPMLPSQDHKPAYDGDRGPNTGGMGAYAPATVVDERLMEKIKKEILLPTVRALKDKGLTYKGVLYSGLMVNNGEAKVLEFNVRFGDPEAQVILPLLKTDLVDIAEAILTGNLDEIEIEWEDKKALCVVMASGGYPLNYKKGKKITGLEEANNLDSITVFQAGTKMLKGELRTDGGRVLAVTALGADYEEVIKKAYTGVDYIYFDDFHIRHDIGHKAIKRD